MRLGALKITNGGNGGGAPRPGAGGGVCSWVLASRPLDNSIGQRGCPKYRSKKPEAVLAKKRKGRNPAQLTPHPSDQVKKGGAWKFHMQKS